LVGSIALQPDVTNFDNYNFQIGAMVPPDILFKSSSPFFRIPINAFIKAITAVFTLMNGVLDPDY